MTNVDFGRYKRIVQYFWNTEPKNDDVSQGPVWCLGQQYAASPPAPASPPLPATVQHGLRQAAASSGDSTAKIAESFSSAELVTPDTSISGSPEDALAYGEARNGADDAGWPTSFLDDFESRIWLTYRSNFSPIPKSREPGAAANVSIGVRLRSQLLEQGGFTSDTGWGCMIRSGQSILANALVMLRLGRDWRHGARHGDDAPLLSLFADNPRAAFSIHRFVEHGASACGKYPGEWFGPSATARCIQALTNHYSEAGMRVYITGDGSDVYEDSFMETARPDGHIFLPTLVLVGIRLGIDRVTPVYWEALTASLRLRQSVGIAGGRPSSSHYFVGVQGSNLFYLDPHQTRSALPLHEDASQYTAEEIDSCHTRRLRRLHLSEMDPSMLIAFLIRDRDDWEDWRRSVVDLPGKPIIRVSDYAVSLSGPGSERSSAVDEVEVLDEEDGDDDDVDVITISGSEV